MNYALIPLILSSFVAMSCFMAISILQQRMLKRSWAREKNLIADVDWLLAKVETLTASLNQSSETIERMVTEQRRQRMEGRS